MKEGREKGSNERTNAYFRHKLVNEHTHSAHTQKREKKDSDTVYSCRVQLPLITFLQ